MAVIDIILKPGTKSVYFVRRDRTWPEKMNARQVLALLSDERNTVAPGCQGLVDRIRALSADQVARQDYRAEDGKYAETIKCYCCGGKAPITSYFSHRCTDDVDAAGNHWGDLALVLCGRCSTELHALPDAEAFKIVNGDVPVPWKRTRKEVAA